MRFVLFSFAYCGIVFAVIRGDPPSWNEHSLSTKDADWLWAESPSIMRIRTTGEWDEFYALSSGEIFLTLFAKSVRKNIALYSCIFIALKRIAPLEASLPLSDSNPTRHTNSRLLGPEGNLNSDPIWMRFFKPDPAISGKEKAYSFMFLLVAFSVWTYETNVTPLVTSLANLAANPNVSLLSDENGQLVGIFDWTSKSGGVLLTKWMVILWALNAELSHDNESDAGSTSAEEVSDSGSISESQSNDFLRNAEMSFKLGKCQKMVSFLEHTPFTTVRERGRDILQWIVYGCSEYKASGIGLQTVSSSSDSHQSWFEWLSQFVNIFCPTDGSRCAESN